MRKYESIIRNLSLKEKVHLLLTSKDNISQTISNYSFPEVKIETNFKVITDNNIDSLSSIALTWNADLVKELGKVVGNNYNHAAIEVKLSTADNSIDYVSSDNFFSGVIAGNFIKGLEESNSFSILSTMKENNTDLEDYRNDKILALEIANTIGNPTMIKSTNTDAIKILNEWKYKGYKYLNAANSLETIKGLSEGCSFINSIYEEEVINAINLYQEKKISLVKGEISELEFDDLLLNGVILEPSKIDDLLDKYFSMLDRLNNIYEKKVEIEEYSESFYEESIVLLENDGTLPYTNELKNTCLLGEIIEQYSESNSLFEYIRANGNQFGGYVRGYSSEIDFEETSKLALDYINPFDTVISFLPTEDGLIDSNIKQMFLNIKNKGKKHILVLFGSISLREDLSDYANSIIQVPEYKCQYFKPVMDVLFGKINPSGRISTIGNEKGIFNRKELIDNLEAPLYPFGYGLSYTEFVYSNYSFYKNKIEVVIENKGAFDGFEVIQVYVKKPYEDYKRLAGFRKVFLKAGEKRCFDLHLDDKAFRYYNKEENAFGIKKGLYEVSLCMNADETILSQTIELDEFLDKNKDYQNLLEESDSSLLIKDFTLTNAKKNYRKDKIGMSFKTKLIIAILLDSYYSILFGFFTFFSILNEDYLVTIIFGVLLLLVNIIFVIALIKFCKTKKKQEYLDRKFAEEDRLALMIDRMPLFNEISSFMYNAPEVTIEDKEEIKPEEDATSLEVVEEADIEEQVLKAEEPEVAAISVDDDEDLEFTRPYVVPELKGLNKEKGKLLLLDNLCSQFNSLLIKSGLVLELSQIRSLLASVLSSKMIFASSNNKEGLNHVFKMLDAFFGNQLNIIHSNDSWENTIDLLWKPSSEEGVYTYSDFSIELLTAKNNPEGLKLIVLDNVDIDTFPKYFHKFIRSTQSSKIDYYIRLDEIIKIPTNVCYVLIPSDDNFMEHMNPKIIDASLTLNLDITNSEITEVEVEPYSYLELISQIKDRINDVFMDEEKWKKLDDLEDEIHALDITYHHSNRCALLMEKFLSILLMLDPDRYVLEDALAMYFIPLLKALPLYKKNNGDQEIKDIIIKIFGSDNLSYALNMLNKPLATIEEQSIEEQNIKEKFTEKQSVEEHFVKEETSNENDNH